MPALHIKILHFATWKCLISIPILVLMYKYMILGVAQSPAKEQYCWLAKDAKFQARF